MHCLDMSIQYREVTESHKDSKTSLLWEFTSFCLSIGNQLCERDYLFLLHCQSISSSLNHKALRVAETACYRVLTFMMAFGFNVIVCILISFQHVAKIKQVNFYGKI